MNCQQFGEYRIEIARNSPLQAGLKAEAAAHADLCPACQRLLTVERSLHSALASLPQKSTTHVIPLKLESKMVELFRENISTPTIPAKSGLKTSPKPSWHRRPSILAAAAIFILTISLLGLWISPSFLRDKIGPVSTAKKIVNAEQSLKPSIEPAVMAQSYAISQQARDALLSNKKSASVKHSGHGIVAKQRTPSPKTTEESKPKQTVEPVTDFIEVSPLEEIYPQEIRQVVRVRLSRGSLARFGFPMNVERIQEPVQADFLLSQEGWIKAVRFVK